MNNQHNKQRQFIPARLLIGMALAASLTASANYTWNTEAGGYWHDTTKWNDGTGSDFPILGTTAYLNNTTSDRVVTYTGEGVRDDQKWLRNLSITQTSAALNQLSLLNNLKFSNGFTLSASGGGTTRLFLSNYELGGSNTTTTVRMQLGESGTDKWVTIGANSVLDIGGKVENSGNTVATIAYGTVYLNGGQINLQKAVKTGTNGSAAYSFTGALAIAAGKLSLGADSAYTDATNFVTDIRFYISENFTMTGGEIANIDGSTKLFSLKGENNEISGNSVIGNNITFTLGRSGTQKLASTAVLGALNIEVSSATVTTLGVTGADANGANIGAIKLQQTSSAANASLTLRLDNDLTLKSGANIYASGNGGVDQSYVIDTGGHTLDLSRKGGAWEANRTSTSLKADWTLTGGGEIIATGFNFGTTDVSVSVGEHTRLISKGTGASAVSNLGSGGTFDLTSRFIYDGGAGNEGQLQAARAIGILEVESGRLRITGDNDFTAAGGIVVQAGANLDFGSRKVTASTYSIAIDGNAIGTITGNSAIDLNGISLTIDVANLDASAQYDLFGASTTGDLSGVSIVGAYAITLSQTGNLWTGRTNDSLLTFSFDQNSGILSIAAVPESSTVALLAGSAILLFAILRIRRNRRR